MREMTGQTENPVAAIIGIVGSSSQLALGCREPLAWRDNGAITIVGKVSDSDAGA